MNQNSNLKYLFFGLLMLGGFLTAAAAEPETLLSNKLARAVERKVVQAARLSAASQGEFRWVKAHWEMVLTKTFRRRKVSVRMPWGPVRRVETVCKALEREGKLYLTKSCYYPAEKNDYEIKWLGAYFLSGNGEIALNEPETSQEDWVIFALPNNPASEH